MVAVDNFPTHLLGLDSPAEHGAAITPHDTNELAFITRGLTAKTTAGLVTVITKGNDTVEIYLPLGVVIPIRAKVVKNTGLTAAGVVAFW
jgi:hypothetical protein